MSGEFSKVYKDENGASVFVHRGLGGDAWMTMRQKKTSGKHRVKSPVLPVWDTPEEAAADLDAYALKRGWKEEKAE